MTKILIVHEDLLEREILAEMVERQFPKQIQYRMAENGRKAVDTAALWGADIVLMDVKLPGITGTEVAKQILSQLPECQIIFVSGYKEFEYVYKALKLGACDYILKPTSPSELKQAISKAMVKISMLRKLKSTEAKTDDHKEELLSGKHSALMAKVQQYLHDNYMICNISLDSVSAILNMNASYCSVQFKRCFGVNFVDYLTDLRIQAAKKLLEDPLHSAAEIARMVGYESANYFARAFKKKTGMTPMEYRRSTSKSVKKTAP